MKYLQFGNENLIHIDIFSTGVQSSKFSSLFASLQIQLITVREFEAL